jgi:hypothetical protein
MRIQRAGFILASLFAGAAFSLSAVAQQGEAPAPNSPAPAQHPRRGAPAAPPSAEGQAKPTLLGQFASWGAYTASPGGKKVCFAIAKPASAETKPPNRPRGQPHMFISTRPADKVTNEVSISIGYPFKPGYEATAQVGSTTFALSTLAENAWIKNLGEQAHMVETMRSADSVIVKGESSRGTQTTDTYSLKGLSEALDRVAQECQ